MLDRQADHLHLHLHRPPATEGHPPYCRTGREHSTFKKPENALCLRLASRLLSRAFRALELAAAQALNAINIPQYWYCYWYWYCNADIRKSTVNPTSYSRRLLAPSLLHTAKRARPAVQICNTAPSAPRQQLLNHLNQS